MQRTRGYVACRERGTHGDENTSSRPFGRERVGFRTRERDSEAKVSRIAASMGVIVEAMAGFALQHSSRNSDMEAEGCQDENGAVVFFKTNSTTT